MEKDVKIIYSGGGNRLAAKITESIGILQGAQLPDVIYSKSLYFADQDWKNPNKELYLESLKEHKPAMATVLDLEKPDQLEEVLDWASDVSQYCNDIIVIPKFRGSINLIPEIINGKRVVLGYSVPTKFGGTKVPFGEFGNRPVHLLGGQPHVQIMLLDKLNVVSLDNNYIMLKGLTYNCYWTHLESRTWVQLKDAGIDLDKNSNYLAFTISWMNFMEATRLKLSGHRLRFEDKKEYQNKILRWEKGE